MPYQFEVVSVVVGPVLMRPVPPDCVTRVAVVAPGVIEADEVPNTGGVAAGLHFEGGCTVTGPQIVLPVGVVALLVVDTRARFEPGLADFSFE